jgi:polysaccharide export outer membrane protein
MLLIAVMPALFAQSARPDSTLGLGDQVLIRAAHAPEFSERPYRVDESGLLRLPLVGEVRAAGRTTAELATEIRSRLASVLVRPEVSVDLMERRSRPVSVIGSVKTPGVYQVEGRRRLVEMLAMAGGLGDDAGFVVRLSRPLTQGDLPLAGARKDPSGQFSVCDVRLDALMGTGDGALNVWVLPEDALFVPRARLIYVMGAVRKPGGFVLREREKLSVSQALALAEGPTSTAWTRHARVLRSAGPGLTRTEITVNLPDILSGRAPDISLSEEDILIVPNNNWKTVAFRSVEASIQMGTSVAIWRR